MTRKCLICGKEFEGRDARTKYCSKECAAEGTKRAYKAKKEAERAERAARPPIPCPICGKLFKPLTGAYKYCSKACADEQQRRNSIAHYKKAKEVGISENICQHCGKTFRAATKYVKYCSAECRKVASIKKQKITYWSRRPKQEKKTSPEQFEQRRGIIYTEEAKRLGKWYENLSADAAEAGGNNMTYGKLKAPKVEVFVPRGLTSAKERETWPNPVI